MLVTATTANCNHCLTSICFIVFTYIFVLYFVHRAAVRAL